MVGAARPPKVLQSGYRDLIENVVSTMTCMCDISAFAYVISDVHCVLADSVVPMYDAMIDMYIGRASGCMGSCAIFVYTYRVL